jgi:spore coat-associated protein N
MSDDDNSTGLELTRRRILGGIGTIGAASAAAGAGTFAYFSDTESSTGNTVTAGTLDLTPNGSSVETFSLADVKPSDSGTETIGLTNAGSLPGYLNVSVDVTADSENSLEEPEPSDDDTTSGELAEALDVEIGLDGDENGSIDTSLATADLIGVSGLTGVTYNPNHQLDPSDGSDNDVDFVFDWNVPASVGNEIQGDSFTVDFTFELSQQAANADKVLTGSSAAIESGENPLQTSSDAKWGSGSWTNDSGNHGRLYFAGQFSDFHALPEFTVGEIAEISYHTKKSQPFGTNDRDFFLHIYTTTDSVTDPDGWYGRRLTALPRYAANRNAPAGQWNKWSTSSGTNQLQFYDMNDTSSGDSVPLSDIQAGNYPWTDSSDYASQTVKTLSITADDVAFDSKVDAVTLELTTGESLTLDLEP